MRTLLSILVLVFVAGCVRTNVTSVANLSVRANEPFKRLLVSATKMPLDEALAVEGALAKQLANKGMFALQRTKVLPPTQEYTPQEIGRVMQTNNLDGILIVSLGNKSTNESYVPPTYHPGTTTGTVNVVGNTAYMNSYTTPGYTTGGYSISKPSALYSASLYDYRSGKRVWYATGKSRGNAFSDYRDLGASMATETIDKLAGDNVIVFSKGKKPSGK